MATSFTPKLDRIIEESFSRNNEEGVEISNAILDEYEVLTEQDLLVALDLNTNKYKEGEYLNGIAYKRDTDNDTEGEFSDDDGIDGLIAVSNGYHSYGSPGAFARMHTGTQVKNIEIMERFRGGTGGSIGTASRERLDQMAQHNDDVMSVTSDSSSLSKISKRRKISGHSSHSHFFMMKTGDELLKKYLQAHEGYEFDSKEGRKIFVKSILKKYMTMYYVISPSKVTSPDYDCSGIATLLAVRNALKMKDTQLLHGNGGDNDVSDTDSMITSCMMFDYHGNDLNFDEFACIAKLNDLSVEAVVVSKDSDVKQFRYE